MRFVAGVDCHKHSHTIVVIDQVGTQQACLKITADADGYQKAIDFSKPFSDLAWGVESTGFYGYGLAQALVTRGHVVLEVPGTVTKRYRRQGTRHGKSDPIDARAIAEAVLREADRPSRFERNDAQDAIRLLYDRRDRLVKERTTAGNRLRALALRLGLTELPRELWSERRLQSVRAQLDRFRGVSLTADALVDEIVEAIADIERCTQRISGLESASRPFVERLAPGLLTIRGVASVVAAGLFGHAGNLRNCRDANAFAMRAGVAPLTFASGSSSTVRVNYLGNRQLNRCLHVIGMVQIRVTNHPGRVYYDRKRAEGKTHRAALRALKRQLATIVYFRLRHDFRVTDRRSAAPISSAA